MSAYTTLRVSRRAALAKLAELRARGPTNDQLEDELEERLTERTLYNFSVVDDDGQDDEVKRNDEILKDLRAP